MKGIKKLTKYKLTGTCGSGPIKGAGKKEGIEKYVEARGVRKLRGREVSRERLVERGVERERVT